MSRSLRIAAIVAASSVVITGSVAAFAAVGNGFVHGVATATAIPLPPLARSQALGGSTVYASDGTTVLAVLHGSEDRKPVRLSHVTKVMIEAVLDTEDHRFFIHGGFDIPSTVRALAADTSASGGLQGGSTITQQLVKQIYLTSERKLSRKIKEAVLADRLERKYTKDQILEAYLNTIYFGNGAYGVEAAANQYFNEGSNQLTLPQAALLAGMISNPSGYDPILDPVDSRSRRSVVLSRMRHYGDITAEQESAANGTPLPTAIIKPPVAGDDITNYYVQQVQTELLGSGSPIGGNYRERYNSLFEGGLNIYTNLDPNLQAGAEQAVARDTPPNNRNFSEAMVAIDPATGKVRAMVGGTGFKASQVDVVTSKRQPGSGFKLFTLLAALQQGYSIYDTLLGRDPCAIDFPNNHDLLTKPAKNAEHSGGVMTLLQATANSVNCAFIRLAHEVGLENVVAMAHAMGITANLDPYPSMVIGGDVVSPLQMAAAYATVAADGVYHTPSFIDHIVDRTGSTVWTNPYTGRAVISPQIAREATVALRAVVQYGTGTAASLYDREVAGKTGTTDHNVDAWFNGFTPQLEATVWMGNVNHDSGPLAQMIDVGGYSQVFGGTYPAITWHDFMVQAMAGLLPIAFASPDYGLVPASKYITSPGLVRDDVLDHNYGYIPPPPPPCCFAPPSTTPSTTPSPTGPTSNPPPSTVPATTNPPHH